MKAIIFSAGLGTRLKPLTNDKPKALVMYEGKTLLQRAIEKLSRAGFEELVVNVHHFSEQIIEFLNDNDNFGQKIHISDETDSLLDTGGGLYKASKYFDEPFLLYNVDIFSDINLREMFAYHTGSDNLATLAVQSRLSNKRLYFDRSTMSLCKWRNEVTGEEKVVRNSHSCISFAFSGIHVASPQLFDFMESGKYSIIDTYLLAAKTAKISYFDHSSGFWRDMGHLRFYNKK